MPVDVESIAVFGDGEPTGLKRTRVDPQLEQHLRDLEEQLLQSQVRTCAEKVRALLADEFVEFGASGRVWNKEEIVEALKSEAPCRRSMADFSVRGLVPDAALVTYRATRYYDSGESPIQTLRSSIWRLIDDRWQMVFHQGTRAASCSACACAVPRSNFARCPRRSRPSPWTPGSTIFRRSTANFIKRSGRVPVRFVEQEDRLRFGRAREPSVVTCHERRDDSREDRCDHDERNGTFR
jgi:hypothetical protein